MRFGSIGRPAARAAALCAGFLFPVVATASLVGDSVRYERIFMENVERAADFVVVEGEVEFTDQMLLDIDVEADTITLTVNPPQERVSWDPPQRVELTDLDWSEGPIESVSVDFADATGFDPMGVSFTENSVSIELGGVILSATGFIEVHLPEPGAPLAGLALAASLTGLARKRV